MKTARPASDDRNACRSRRSEDLLGDLLCAQCQQADSGRYTSYCHRAVDPSARNRDQGKATLHTAGAIAGDKRPAT